MRMIQVPLFLKIDWAVICLQITTRIMSMARIVSEGYKSSQDRSLLHRDADLKNEQKVTHNFVANLAQRSAC